MNNNQTNEKGWAKSMIIFMMARKGQWRFSLKRSEIIQNLEGGKAQDKHRRLNTALRELRAKSSAPMEYGQTLSFSRREMTLLFHALGGKAKEAVLEWNNWVKKRKKEETDIYELVATVLACPGNSMRARTLQFLRNTVNNETTLTCESVSVGEHDTDKDKE